MERRVGDRFSLADGTSGRRLEPVPLPEHESAPSAFGRNLIQLSPLGMKAFPKVLQVILDFFFRPVDGDGNLLRRVRPLLQQGADLTPCGFSFPQHSDDGSGIHPLIIARLPSMRMSCGEGNPLPVRIPLDCNGNPASPAQSALLLPDPRVGFRGAPARRRPTGERAAGWSQEHGLDHVQLVVERGGILPYESLPPDPVLPGGGPARIPIEGKTVLPIARGCPPSEEPMPHHLPVGTHFRNGGASPSALFSISTSMWITSPTYARIGVTVTCRTARSMLTSPKSAILPIGAGPAETASPGRQNAHSRPAARAMVVSLKRIRTPPSGICHLDVGIPGIDWKPRVARPLTVNKKGQGDCVPLPERPRNPCGVGPLPGKTAYFFSAGAGAGFTASSTFSAAFFVAFFAALPVAFTPFTEDAVPSTYFT